MLDMHIRPSELIGIDDTYTAFCFDEDCAFIIKNIKDGLEPTISMNGPGEEKGVYSKPSDLYKKYEV